MKKKASKCPDCGDIVYAEPVNRRNFLKAAGLGAASLAMAKVSWARPDQTSEELIKELYKGLSEEQRKQVVYSIQDSARGKIYNAALKVKIGTAYTKPQQDLVQKILRSMAS